MRDLPDRPFKVHLPLTPQAERLGALLSPVDRELADSVGDRIEYRDDVFPLLVSVRHTFRSLITRRFHHKRVSFTSRGLAYYRYLLARLRLPADMTDLIRNGRDYSRMIGMISDVELAKFAEEFRRDLQQRYKQLTPEQREFRQVFLHGTLQELVDIGDKHTICEATGRNVIPVSFGRRSH